MNLQPSIVWFRQDLRIEDNLALAAAAQKGGGIIPLFIWAPEEEKKWAPGEASRWWLHHSLESLQADLVRLKLKLIIRRQPSLLALLDVIRSTGADAVFWQRRYEPTIIQRDTLIRIELQKQGIKVQSFNGNLLFEPWEILNKQNKPFQVFTPFWKHCLNLEEPRFPYHISIPFKSHPDSIDSLVLSDLNLLPKIPWDKGLKANWKPGARGAKQKLADAIQYVISNYSSNRDRLDLEGVSYLSPYLHYGEISPQMIWHTVRQRFGGQNEGANAFLRQLGWREFAYHLLYHFPYTTHEPLKPNFTKFPWKIDQEALRAWQKGQTGYPLIDAGMRQLWKMGWVHNRARMLVASFLVKDLNIPWQEGAKWFWDTLVDADLANNTLGWQWVAGCGADASPFFRIFNPITQGKKFDVTGEYVRKWVPELKKLPNQWIHQPWNAPENILKEADITLGIHYPLPIVDHQLAKERALLAYNQLGQHV